MATVPGFTSLIDRKALLDNSMKETVKQITALDAEYARQTAEFLKKKVTLTTKRSDLSKRMVFMEARRGDQPKAISISSSTNLCGQKRQRSASF